MRTVSAPSRSLSSACCPPGGECTFSMDIYTRNERKVAPRVAPARAAVAVFDPVPGAGRPAFGPAASSGGPAPLPVPPPCVLWGHSFDSKNRCFHPLPPGPLCARRPDPPGRASWSYINGLALRSAAVVRLSKDSPGLWATRLEKRLPAWHFCGPKALARCHNLIQTRKKIAREKTRRASS